MALKWDEMSPRERDVLVQEKVFGNRIITDYWGQLKYAIHEMEFSIPNYTTDISAAWEVFQAFAQAWVGYQGTDYACGITDGIGDEAITGRASYDDDHVNASECICLAALRAKGVDV